MSLLSLTTFGGLNQMTCIQFVISVLFIGYVNNVISYRPAVWSINISLLQPKRSVEQKGYTLCTWNTRPVVLTVAVFCGLAET